MVAPAEILKCYVVIGLCLVACTSDEGRQHVKSQEVMASPPSVQSRDSAIRSVDFSNFEYRGEVGQHWTLHNGKYEGGKASEDYPASLAYLSYGDVTSDGVEEAIVVLSESVKGSAIPYYVYIYAPDDPSPNLLWDFETGDRADGGLRQVYAEHGKLIVELYGKGTSIGGKLYGTDPTGACCPNFITRTRYAWNGQKFMPEGEQVLITHAGGGALVTMPKFKRDG